MNNEDFYSADFTNSLPPALKNDPDMMALAQTISAQLRATAAEIRKNIIYARIDELDEATLDVLAYDLHVDWYDYSYPIEVKRRTIRDSIQVHRRLGTKYAVEKALGAVYPGTKVEEWFEYGGDPYKFRVVIGATEAGITADRQAAVLDRVRFYKNLRSHLEAISYQIRKANGGQGCRRSRYRATRRSLPILGAKYGIARRVLLRRLYAVRAETCSIPK